MTTAFPEKLIVTPSVLRSDLSVLCYQHEGTQLLVVDEFLANAVTGIVTKLRLRTLIAQLHASDECNVDTLKQSMIPVIPLTDHEKQSLYNASVEYEEVMGGLGMYATPRFYFRKGEDLELSHAILCVRGIGEKAGAIGNSAEVELMRSVGITAMTPSDFKHQATQIDKRMEKWVHIYKSLDVLFFLLLPLGLLPLLTFGIVQLFQVPMAVFGKLPYWGSVALLLSLSFTLYWLRRHFRGVYGLGEIAAGMGTGYLVFWGESDHKDINNWLKFLAAVYVMVRGLDNVGEWTEKHKSGDTWYSRRWLKVFGKKPD